MTYTEAMFNNKAAKQNAKSSNNKENLRNEIFAQTGWMPPKNLSMKQMRAAAGV